MAFWALILPVWRVNPAVNQRKEDNTMPLYDYQCEQCNTVFEVRATIREKE